MRYRPYLKKSNNYFRCDETYIKAKGRWKYLYRAVDSNGNMLDFLLTANRDKHAALRFFKKVLGSAHVKIPRVISVDKNPAYPTVIDMLKKDNIIPKETQLRQSKYLNKALLQK